MKRTVLMSGLVLALLLVGPAMVAAATYTYQEFNLSPSSIPQNGVTNIVLETHDSTTVPSGSGNWVCTSSGQLLNSANQVVGTCTLPFVPPGPACNDNTTGFVNYEITQLKVTTPNDPSSPDVYMLGTTSGPGISGAPLIVTKLDEPINVPYGPAPGGSPFTINGNTYEWWRIRLNGNSVSPNQNIVSSPTPGPTSLAGTYTIDLEGVMHCGTSATAITQSFFFDIGIQVTTPEFGAMLIAVALGSLALAFVKRRVVAPSIVK